MLRTLILGACQAGLPIPVLADQLIAPAMIHIGYEWERGRMDVHIEHRISQAVISTLYELRSFLNVNNDATRPVAIGGAPEHDYYAIPTLLAKLTLLEGGWDAINLGPHLPMSALERAIADLKPRLVWLCVSHIADLEEFVTAYTKMYALAERHGAAVAIGGRGLSESIRRRMSYTTYGDGLSQLAAFAKSLHARPTQPKRGRPPKSASNATLPQNDQNN
jgi:methanogenic corrinoid protein MtbC1